MRLPFVAAPTYFIHLYYFFCKYRSTKYVYCKRMNTFNKNFGNPDSAKIIQHLLEIVYIEEKDQG
jgi:hypothetical protein